MKCVFNALNVIYSIEEIIKVGVRQKKYLINIR